MSTTTVHTSHITDVSKIIKKLLRAEGLEAFTFISRIDQEEREWYETAINGQALLYLYPRKIQIVRQIKRHTNYDLDTCIMFTDRFLEHWNRESVFLAFNFMNVHASNSFFAATNVLMEASKHGLRQGDPYSIW